MCECQLLQCGEKSLFCFFILKDIPIQNLHQLSHSKKKKKEREKQKPLTTVNFTQRTSNNELYIY